MSLWAEHVGKVDPCFEVPHGLDCIKCVNRIADENWTRYTAEEVIPLQGHLIRYPIMVDAYGMVTPLPGKESFPDVGGKILGEHTTLPDQLTM